jgi:hypothetical protein
MQRSTSVFLWAAVAGMLCLSSCFNIIEEVTLKADGSGTYSMKFDMSEMKGMMDMLKSMPMDSIGAEGIDMSALGSEANMFSQFGESMAGVEKILKGVPGISNVKEVNDTTTLTNMYQFDFADIASLNQAMRIITKQRYPEKAEEVFVLKGKNFERLPAADIGTGIAKAFKDQMQGQETGAMFDPAMLQSFLGGVTYTQIYHFPDREIKSSSNERSQVSEDKHRISIALKPFEDASGAAAKKDQGVATAIKLK